MMHRIRSHIRRQARIALCVAVLVAGMVGLDSLIEAQHNEAEAQRPWKCFLFCTPGRTVVKNKDGSKTIVTIRPNGNVDIRKTDSNNRVIWRHNQQTDPGRFQNPGNQNPGNQQPGNQQPGNQNPNTRPYHSPAKPKEIHDRIRQRDGINGFSADRAINAIKTYYRNNPSEERPYGTYSRHSMNYALCEANGLSGCSATDKAQTLNIMCSSGLTRGFNGCDDFGGELPVSWGNISPDASDWMGRCPRNSNMCGRGYVPPGGHRQQQRQQQQNNACPAGMSVINAHKRGSDNGCRPVRCDFGRGSDGWCLPPASDAPPVVYLINPIGAVGEGDGNAEVEMRLSHRFTGTVTLKVNTADGTATAGSDYTALSEQTVTFSPNDTRETVQIPLVNDTVHEPDPDETFTLSMSDVSANARLDSIIARTVSISDNDWPVITISGPSQPVSEGGILDYTVSIDRRGYTGTVTVNQAATGAGEGVIKSPTGRCSDNNGDFASVDGVLTWVGSNTDTKTVSVATCGSDAAGEADETVRVTLSSPNPVGVSIPSPAATGIIRDAPAPFDYRAFRCDARSDGDFDLTFTFDTRSGNYRWRLDSEAWTTLNTNGQRGTKVRRTETKTVNIAGVYVAEAQRQFTWLQNQPWRGSPLSTACVSPVSVTDVEVGEADVIAEFSVTISTRTALTNAVLTVAYADGTAVAPGDYTLPAGNRTTTRTFATLPVGSQTETFFVDIVDDDIHEPTETFTLTATLTAGDTTIGSDTATTTITDEDEAPPSFLS